MLSTKWLSVLALSFYRFPTVMSRRESADEVSWMFNPSEVENPLKVVENSLKETLEKMEEILGAELQVSHDFILGAITIRGQAFEAEVM